MCGWNLRKRWTLDATNIIRESAECECENWFRKKDKRLLLAAISDNDFEPHPNSWGILLAKCINHCRECMSAAWCGLSTHNNTHASDIRCSISNTRPMENCNRFFRSLCCSCEAASTMGLHTVIAEKVQCTSIGCPFHCVLSSSWMHSAFFSEHRQRIDSFFFSKNYIKFVLHLTSSATEFTPKPHRIGMKTEYRFHMASQISTRKCVRIVTMENYLKRGHFRRIFCRKRKSFYLFFPPTLSTFVYLYL